MKEITAWKTDDEKVFEDGIKATKWQAYLDIRIELVKLIAESTIVGNFDNTDDDIVNFIIEDEKKLQDLFEKYGIIDVEDIRY